MMMMWFFIELLSIVTISNSNQDLIHIFHFEIISLNEQILFYHQSCANRSILMHRFRANSRQSQEKKKI